MAKQKILRTTAELNARYARFCDTYDLDDTIAPAEQIAENDKQQRWLDAHVEALELALALATENHSKAISANVTLEKASKGSQKAAAILSAIGKKDMALSVMLRKGEQLAASLNIIETSRKVAMTICQPAGYNVVDSKTTKRGHVQMGWGF